MNEYEAEVECSDCKESGGLCYFCDFFDYDASLPTPSHIPSIDYRQTPPNMNKRPFPEDLWICCECGGEHLWALQLVCCLCEHEPCSTCSYGGRLVWAFMFKDSNFIFRRFRLGTLLPTSNSLRIFTFFPNLCGMICYVLGVYLREQLEIVLDWRFRGRESLVECSVTDFENRLY